MLYRHYPPTPRLAPFVASMWLYRNDPQPRVRMLPSGTAQVVIDLSGGGMTLPRPGPCPPSGPPSGPLFTTHSRGAYATILHGVDSTAFSHESDRPLYRFGVDFRPGGLYPFFAPPPGELHNMHVSLDALWGAQVVRELCERMAEADTLEERAGIVEELLLRQVICPRDHHLAVTYALRAFSLAKAPTIPSVSSRGQAHGQLARTTPMAPVERVAWVAEEAGISTGRFTRLFRDEVGLTPKQFVRVRRFQRVLRVLQRTRREPSEPSEPSELSERRVHWARIALDCGYYDQAHLINDFQAFAGVCPSAYLRARRAHNPSQLRED